jgi:hypothetical protein
VHDARQFRRHVCDEFPAVREGGSAHFLRNLIYVTVIVITAFTFARRFRHLPKEQPAVA